MNSNDADKKQTAFEKQIEREKQERESLSPAPDLMQVFQDVGNFIAGILWEYGGKIGIDRKNSRLFTGPLSLNDYKIAQPIRTEKTYDADVVLLGQLEAPMCIDRDFLREWSERNNLKIEGVIVAEPQLKIFLTYTKNT